MFAIRAVWDEPPPPDPPVRVRRDWVLVGVVVAALLIEGLVRPDLPWRWLQVAAALVLVPTLLWRRTHPLLPVVGTTVVSAAVMLVMGSDGDLVTAVYGAILVYALFRWGSGRQMVLGAGLLTASLGLTWALGHATGADTVGGASVVAMLAASGLAVRFRSTARRRALAQARAQERERIARDLHDVVGHHVSGIAVRAQAGLAQAEARRHRLGSSATENSDVGVGDPLEAALRVVEAEAKETLVEMRTLVRALREDEQGGAEQGPDRREPDGGGPDRRALDQRADADAEQSVTGSVGCTAVEPGPRAADVVRLAAGPPWPVAVTVRGDVGSVRADVGAAAYRIAQESVTNARRHARGATLVEVVLTAEVAAVRLRVSDDGEPHTAPVAAGNGLTGMLARVRELGGDLTVGPQAPGGWAVEAVLPLAGGLP